ncbi:hypothetical protein ACGFIF_20640 [Kribbella sp. NPDC049174]|uniref:hypothetical protein n=1 Tax=Kribbella sp. NPDC049174 TaxID=3364112 RepID=UPI003712A89C
MSKRVGLGVAFGMLVVATVGAVVTDGLRAALSPAFGAVVLGVLLFRYVRNPPAPRPWTKQRAVATAVVIGVAGAGVIGCLVWVAAIRPEWPLRVVAVFGILFVLGSFLWTLRTAQAEHREALALAQEPES